MFGKAHLFYTSIQKQFLFVPLPFPDLPSSFFILDSSEMNSGVKRVRLATISSGSSPSWTEDCSHLQIQLKIGKHQKKKKRGRRVLMVDDFGYGHPLVFVWFQHAGY